VHVIGTAGHVDHGKSTLVLALTGINPDRLKEEQEREMTIDLGFAWLTLPGGEQVGIIDVPGHKDFINNMLAGVGGIDAALFVVAADEGVMPQTREHLAILDLLGVPGGVVALAKTDLVSDPEWLDLVEADLLETLDGTVLEDAPIVRCSARKRQGLQELLVTLEDYLGSAPARRDLGRPRLPVDRVFTIAGFGTVVTGTLSDGVLRAGQEVEIQPEGLRARIRGLQTHKRKIERAVPGSRVAINLGGVSTEEVKRGDVVSLPGLLRPTSMVDCHLRYLPDAPQALRHNAEVIFFSGAAEVAANVRLLGQRILHPGEEGWVQLRLREPVALVKGDRFIIRQPSPSLTIGGGRVVNPHPRRRYRRFRPEVITQLETLAHGTPEEILLQTLERQQPTEVGTLVKRGGQDPDATTQALEELLRAGQVLVLDSERWGEASDVPDRSGYPLRRSEYVVSRSGWGAIAERLEAILREYHRQHPLRRGMPREELKSRLGQRIRDLSPRLFNDVLAVASAEGLLAEDSSAVWLTSHQVSFTPEQQRRIDALLALFRQAPYTTPSLSQCEESVGSEVLNALLEGGQLVRVGEDVVFLAETYEEMVARVVDYLREHETITVAQLRDLFNTSRKYALALAANLDDRRITRRVGDERVLR
jgi:selenocysteine-specific elongation factor